MKGRRINDECFSGIPIKCQCHCSIKQICTQKKTLCPHTYNNAPMCPETLITALRYLVVTFSSCVILPVREENSAEAGGYRCCSESPIGNGPSSHSPPRLWDVVLHCSCPPGCSTPPRGSLGPLYVQESAPRSLNRCRKQCINSFKIY